MDTDLGEKHTFYNPAYYGDTARCLVPACQKYRREYPDLKFFGIPSSLKENWCRALEKTTPKRTLYVCENHINIEQDCYISKSGKLKLKPTANLIITKTWNEEVPVTKKPKMSDTYINQKEPLQSILNIPTGSDTPVTKHEVATQCSSKGVHRAVLAKPSLRSVGSGANIRVDDISVKALPTKKQYTETIGMASTSTSGTSTPSIYTPSTYSCPSSEEIKEKKDFSGCTHMLKIIENDPKFYIGIPNKYYWMLDLIAKECHLKKIHVIITLFKIKQNDTLKRIANHFDLTEASIQNILQKCMSSIASYLQNFIYLPTPIQIKSTLPPVFKIRYASVQCIIDCFEIEIQKPLDPIKQAQTWSNYKNCNTIKYLVASCPNGFICFVSEGYGGRISDKAITECSGFIDILPQNAVILADQERSACHKPKKKKKKILADRGFKGLTSLLKDKNIQLLHPPSVSSNETPSKEEVIKSKVIASLRVHIERVIRRLREFYFLKPHSVVNHNHIGFIDEAVIIACALSNLQEEIIKY